MSVVSAAWPSSHLDPVRRMRILVAGIPRVAYMERIVDAPYEAVWSVASDLERGTPLWEMNVAALGILHRDGERLDVDIRSPFGFRLHACAVLRPGWCVMQGTLFSVGMAAVSEGGRTRFAHFEALRLPGTGLLRPLLRHRIGHEFEILERLARERNAGDS